MSTVQDIKEAKEELAACERRHAMEREPILARLEELQLQYADELFGIRIGSLVKMPSGKVYKINSIDVEYMRPGSPPWLRGYLRKNDGTVSDKALHTLYGNWTVIER